MSADARPEGDAMPLPDARLGDTAPASSLVASVSFEPLTASNDTSPVCRICLGEDNDDDELGKLIVPCGCRGTSRFVHQECLRSWRSADKQNSFYACTHCGEAYRFRSTGWSKLLGRRYAVTVIALLLFVLSAELAGRFVAGPLLGRADRDSLALDRTLRSNYWDDLFFIGGKPAGDAIREALSTAGTALGDCRWSSARELVAEPPKEVYVDDGDGFTFTGTVWTFVNPNSTTCGRYWGKDLDDKQVAAPLARVLLSRIKGLASLGWLYAFGARLFRQWVLVAITIRMLLPQVGNRLPRSNFHGLSQFGAALLGDYVFTTRLWVKRARLDGRLFSILQVSWVACTPVLLCLAYLLARDFARFMVKRGLGRVEALVLDLEVAEREESKKQQ